MKRKKENVRDKKTISRVQLLTVAKRVLQKLGILDGEIKIFFLRDREMREVKFAATGERKKVVDVLSFLEPDLFPHPEARGKIIGEIYINFEMYGHDRRRILFLLIHGILHLFHFHHNNKRDTIKMRRAEKMLFHAADL